MPPAGFEPVIPVGDRPQTHASDRLATGIGTITSIEEKKKQSQLTEMKKGYKNSEILSGHFAVRMPVDIKLDTRHHHVNLNA
jgi:hypothetical protein